MIRKILTISGKPGLYRLLSQGRGTLIVENVTDGHRFPVHARDQVVSLGDISMYTESGDTPLGEILEKVKEHNKGEKIDMKRFDSDQAFHDEFAAIVEDYDRERVHGRDIKKLFSWYNIMTGAGITEFVEKQGEKEAEAESGAAKE